MPQKQLTKRQCKKLVDLVFQPLPESAPSTGCGSIDISLRRLRRYHAAHAAWNRLQARKLEAGSSRAGFLRAEKRHRDWTIMLREVEQANSDDGGGKS